MLAAAQNGDPIGQAADLVEPVRDVKDSGALAAEPAQRIKQRLRLPVRQRRGRFVQYDHWRAAYQRARDLDICFCAVDSAVTGVRTSIALASPRPCNAVLAMRSARRRE